MAGEQNQSTRPPVGSRVRMRGRHPNPDGTIECYEHEGEAARAFVKLDIRASGLSGYWCQPSDYEVCK